MQALPQILGTVAGSGLGSQFLPGLASDVGLNFLTPALGGALGGAAGGGLTGGGKGALEGALGGYFGGPAIDKGVSSLFSGAGGATGADIVGGGSDALGGSAGSDVLSSPTVPTPTAAPFAGGGLSASGFGGAIGDAGADGSIPGLTTAQQQLSPEVIPPSLSGGVSGSPTIAPTIPNISAAAPAAGGGLGGGLDKILGGQKGILGQLLPAALLAGSISQANKPQPEIAQLQKLADQQGGASAQLGGAVTPAVIDAITKGTVPAAVQQSIDAQVKAQQAAIRSKYAQMGLTGSTPELQELSAAEQQGRTLAYQQAQSLAATGLSAISQSNSQAGQSAGLLEAILQAQTSQGTELGTALAQYAAALAK